jgi:uncharacterized protein
MRDVMEFRRGFELRAIGGRKLAGYAAVFNTEAQIGNMGASFRERVMPGAFSRTLAARSDVPALVDHDPSKLLARTASGTLRLAEDARGLAFEIDTPDTQLGRDMTALAERRDLGGMSFGFRVAPGGEAWTADLRTLSNLDLIEISIAQAWPAYPDTSIGLRSRDKMATALDAAARRRLLDML